MKRIAALVAGLLILAAAAQPAEAQRRYGKSDSLGSGWSQQQDQAREDVREGRVIPLTQVLETIRRRVPGRALDAGLERYGAATVYRVRWMTNDGRRIDFIVDATTGAILVG